MKEKVIDMKKVVEEKTTADVRENGGGSSPVQTVRPVLSGYILARNEAQNIGRAIVSLFGKVEEIVVVVDSRSEDGTWEAVQGVLKDAPMGTFTRVEHFIFPDDLPEADRAEHDECEGYWKEQGQPGADWHFAGARNYCIGLCTGEWILQLDADEHLTSNSNPMTALMNVPTEIRMFMTPIGMCDHDSAAEVQFAGERLFRRVERYHDAMHNWIETPPEGRALADGIGGRPAVMIAHDRTCREPHYRSARANQRMDLARKYYGWRIAKNPEDKRALFYLAGTYYEAGDNQTAAPLYEKYIVTGGQYDQECFQGGLNLARCYQRMEQPEEAESAILRVLNRDPMRAEGYLLLGDLATFKKDSYRAEHWYKMASLHPPHSSPMFLEPDCHTWLPRLRLAQTFMERGGYEEALSEVRAAIGTGCEIHLAGSLGREIKNRGWACTTGPNIAVCVDRGQMDFLAPVLEVFREREDARLKIVTEPEKIAEAMEWADLAWFEWAGPLLVEATKAGKKPCRIVTRIHGYECYGDILAKIDWLLVDQVIFVSHDKASRATEMQPEIAALCEAHVVPGGVKAAETIETTKTGNKVGMLAYQNYRKNLPLAIQVFNKAHEARSQLQLYIAGRWQDQRTYDYCNTMIEELGLNDSIFLLEEQSSPWTFFADKDFVLSTSIEESLQYSVIEGMMMGCKPAIHSWKSSRDSYPDEWIFRTVDEGAAMLLDAGNPAGYEAYARENLSAEKNKSRIRRILNAPRVAVLGTPSPHRRLESSFEFRLSQVLGDLGCRVVEPQDAELAIITGHHPDESLPEGVKTVLWQAESIAGDKMTDSRLPSIVEAAKKADFVFCHSSYMADIIEDETGKRPRVLYQSAVWPPLLPGGANRDIDVAFVGLLNGRRNKLVEAIGKTDDCNLSVFSGIELDEMAAVYQRAKVVLSVHWGAPPYVNAETRISEALATGARVVTEPLSYGHPFDEAIKQGWVIEAKGARGLRRACRRALKAGHDPRIARWAWKYLRLDLQVEKLLEKCNAG